MQKSSDDIKIFACNANKKLAAGIASDLGVNLGLSEALRFSDGEINMRINETVRNADVFIIQSTEPPVNENLMEFERSYKFKVGCEFINLCRDK